MLKSVAIAVLLAGWGAAAPAAAQESGDDMSMPVGEDSDDDLYMPVGEDHDWYLQRSTCTLAHSANGESLEVVRFRQTMGTEIEFVDPALRNVRDGESADFEVAVDGASEQAWGMGIHEDDRQGYLLTLGSPDILDRLAAGRTLEARAGRRTLLRLDLAGAGPAIAALRECSGAMDAAAEMDTSTTDALEDAADAAGDSTM